MVKLAATILILGSLLAMAQIATAADAPEPQSSGNGLLNELTSYKADYSTGEDRADKPTRMKAMRETAISLGARGGLYARAQEIRRQLESRAKVLDRIDFGPLLLTTPEGRNIVPAVIVKEDGVMAVEEAGRIFRVASQTYRIARQARFTAAIPTWRSYLLMDEFTRPERPPMPLLPATDEERALWREWVVNGWSKGIAQADDIFELQMQRMRRDYVGMVRYRLMVSYGMIVEPKIERSHMPVAGGGDKMSIDDTVLEIKVSPKLSQNSINWRVFPQLPDTEYLNVR